MKKQLLACLVLAMGTMTGAAHAAWGVMTSADGHATVTGTATWSIAEETQGQWKTDGTVTNALVMKVKNETATNAGRFALSTDDANHDATGWFITKVDDGNKKIKLKTTNDKLTWDSTRLNYKYAETVAKGSEVQLNFEPDQTAALEAGEYKIKMNLLVENP